MHKIATTQVNAINTTATSSGCWGRRRRGWFPRRRCPIQRGRRDGVHRRARWTAQPGEHAMTSRAQHYRDAEWLLSEFEDPTWANTPTPWSPTRRSAPPWPPSATTPTTSTWTCAPWRRRAKRWPGRRRRRAVTGSRTTTNQRAQDASVERLPCLRGAEERAAKVRAARARAQALKAQVSAATSRYVAL